MMASHSRYLASTFRSPLLRFIFILSSLLSRNFIWLLGWLFVFLRSADRERATAMSVLDIPLDALAFNYVSFGFFTLVNNLWTWVAVVTAAVSFWSIRIRAAASSTKAAVISPPKSDPPQLLHRKTEASSPSSAMTEEGPAPSKVPAAAVAAVEGDGGLTKGKFSVYYENDRESDGGEVELVGHSGGLYGGEWSQWWEGVMKARMGELGLYRCQDRTVLNGSVVRLWDGCGSGGLLW